MKEYSEEQYCCKWCDHCMNTNLELNRGFCYVDIGEQISDTRIKGCCDFSFDDNLDRC